MLRPACRLSGWLLLLSAACSFNLYADDTSPYCLDIFQDPYLQNLGNQGLQVPEDIFVGSHVTDALNCWGSTINECQSSATNWQKPDTLTFTPGDHVFRQSSLSGGATFYTAGRTARLYFDQLNMDEVNLNPNGKPEDLIIYVRSNFTFTNRSKINGIIYVDNDLPLDFTQGGVINGGFAASGTVSNSNSGGQYQYDRDSILNADFGQMCIPGEKPKPKKLGLQFGSTSVNSVRFDTPFENGVTPLVFLMPNFDTLDPDNDGPATLELTQIDRYGFSFKQVNAPVPEGQPVIPSKIMRDVSWIAVTEGYYTLSNGQNLHAGTVKTNKLLMGIDYNSAGFEMLQLLPKLNTVLTQLQIKKNDCWMTDNAFARDNESYNVQYGQWNIGLDASEAFIPGEQPMCVPGRLTQDQLVEETIAYLALPTGQGEFILDEETVTYNFGSWITQEFAEPSVNCSYEYGLEGFDFPPVFLTSKYSRWGTNGGWPRRCNLFADRFSMVVDEDQYFDLEREHTEELFSYVALEKKGSKLQCFQDDFNRSELGDSWIARYLEGSEVPQIVNGRLQITPDVPNKAASTTYQKLFPTANNRLEIEFDYYAYSATDTPGADGLAIVFSDATITPQPGSFGGSLGYANDLNNDGFAGGWLGIGLDEYGNFSTTKEGRVGGYSKAQPDTVVLRGSQQNQYRFLINSNTLSPVIDDPAAREGIPHRYRVILNTEEKDRALVSVFRAVPTQGNQWETILADFDVLAQEGQTPLPKKLYVSVTSSTGKHSNAHEFDDLSICAIEQEEVGTLIHHFELSVPKDQVLCNPADIFVKACANADCSELITEPVTAYLSLSDPNAATWLGGNRVDFSNGQGMIALQGRELGSVRLDVLGSIPLTMAGSYTTCRQDGGFASASHCAVNFTEAGLLLEIPDKHAGKPVQAKISAVRTDTNTLACTPSFSDLEKPIHLWSSYNAPDEAQLIAANIAQRPQVTIQGQAIGLSSAQASVLPLMFDAQGTAHVELNYAEAGSINVQAQYLGEAGETDEGVSYVGSGHFISAPVGLCLQASSKGKAAPSCEAADGTCAAFAVAGDEFDLTISAHAWGSDQDQNICDNPTVYHYQQAGIALNADLLAPSAGVVGELGASRYDFHIAPNAQTIGQTVSDVGVYQFTAMPPADYLGSSEPLGDLAKAISPPVGRFVPAEFALSNSYLTPACSAGAQAFSYMAQPFELGFTAQALNRQGQITQNYRSSQNPAQNFAHAQAVLVAQAGGMDYAERLPTLESLIWAQGQSYVSDDQVTFARLAAGQMDAPAAPMQFGVYLQDFDRQAALQGGELTVNNPQNCFASPCTASLLGEQIVRQGRLVMDNVYGPSHGTLMMPIRAEYWNGQYWALNQLDSCTLAGGGIAHYNPSWDVTGSVEEGYVYQPQLNVNQAIERLGHAGLMQGESYLTWRVLSDADNQYQGRIQAPLLVPNWLQYPWDWQGKKDKQYQDPQASAYFGTYRGHDRLFFWRERDN